MKKVGLIWDKELYEIYKVLNDLFLFHLFFLNEIMFTVTKFIQIEIIKLKGGLFLISAIWIKGTYRFTVLTNYHVRIFLVCHINPFYRCFKLDQFSLFDTFIMIESLNQIPMQV
jgi:hypothetical protein